MLNLLIHNLLIKMTTKISGIIDELKVLTLLEAAELVKQIETVFDVDASQGAGISEAMAVNTAPIASDVEEQVEFDITLVEVPAPKKIAILKVVRSLTGLGLKEAKTLVESAPKVIKESVSKDDSQQIKNQLEEAGAKVDIK